MYTLLWRWSFKDGRCQEVHSLYRTMKGTCAKLTFNILCTNSWILKVWNQNNPGNLLLSAYFPNNVCKRAVQNVAVLWFNSGANLHNNIPVFSPKLNVPRLQVVTDRATADPLQKEKIKLSTAYTTCMDQRMLSVIWWLFMMKCCLPQVKYDECSLYGSSRAIRMIWTLSLHFVITQMKAVFGIGPAGDWAG